MKGYHHPPVGALAAELSAGLMRLRRGYVDNAESLIRLIEPGQEYPYEFVVFRLTNYRGPRDKAIQPLPGGTLRADLLRLMVQVSESFTLSVSDYDEPVLDMPSAARRFNVSMKTLQRWRAELLPARRIVFPDAKRRIAFLESTLTWFEEIRRESLQRSASFNQLTDAERKDIIRRARRMAKWSRCSLSEVCRRIADRNGRAVETIRYTIRQHDAQAPTEAVFPHLLAGVGPDDREVIYRCFLNGVSVQALARRYNRTRGSVYRIINEMRAKILLEQPIAHIYNPQFEQPDADEVILGPAQLAATAATAEGDTEAMDADTPPPSVSDAKTYISEGRPGAKGKWAIAVKSGAGGKRDAGASRGTGVPPVSHMGVPPMQPLSAGEPFAAPHDQHGLEARATHGRDAHATGDAHATAQPQALLNCFVSNGFLTPLAIETIKPWLDAINVDLKAFRDDTYRRVMHARLEPVLTALRALAAAGVWLEITTLVVPGMNDSDSELRDLATFIATELGPYVPWHVSRFHGDYRMASTPATPARTLQRAVEIGIEAGLYYVYTGNAPNLHAENTHCPRCRHLLIDRAGFTVRKNTIVDGACPACSRKIEGIW